MAAVAAPALREHRTDPPAITRVDEVQHVGQRPAFRMRVQTQTGQAHGVVVDAFGAKVTFPDPEIAGLQGEAQPLLAVAQAQLRLLALVDVDGGAYHAQRPA